MNLREYLFLNRITTKEFAQRIGLTRPYFSRVICGELKGSLKVLERIREETRGLVPIPEGVYCGKQWQKSVAKEGPDEQNGTNVSKKKRSTAKK